MSSPALFHFRDVSFSYHQSPVLTGVNLHLYKKDRICLVGRNGSGKSSLLRILAGQGIIDEGDVFQQPGTTLSYLSQNPLYDPEEKIQHYVLNTLFTHPHFVEKIRFQAQSLLKELCLPIESSMGQLSGGQVRRASLISALITPADIFLLDEPTNHLDIFAIEWLEHWIKKSNKTFIVVSHDRTFLKHVTTKTMWLENKKLYVCPVGFANFDQWQETFLAEQEKALAKIDQKLSQEMHWLHRGVTARRKRNQGRLRGLQALRIQRAKTLQQLSEKPLNLLPTQGVSETRQLLFVDQISYARGEKTLFQDVSFRLLKGDRLGIIGPNGCGKTTFIQVLVGDLQPSSGKVYRPKTFSYALFEQEHSIDLLTKTPWQFLCPQGGDSVSVQGKHRHVVGYLKEFLFTPDQARGQIGLLSGGQRNRLRLAKILARNDPLLILDEPTNDLDIETLDFLQDFLAEYKGTLIIISHDRDFLDRVTTSLLVFSDSIKEYCGSFSEYLKENKTDHPFFSSLLSCTKKKTKHDQSLVEKEKKQQRLSYHEMRLLQVLPEEIAGLEKEKSVLEAKISLLSCSKEHESLGQMAIQLKQRQEAIEKAEKQWLEITERQDALTDQE